MHTKMIVVACCLLITGIAGTSTGTDNARQLKGATIRQQEEWAFTELRWAVKSPQYTDAERKTIASLHTAWQLLGKNEDIRHALEMTQRAVGSLPDEFKYLADYVLGRAHYQIACSAKVNSAQASSLALSAAVNSAQTSLDSSEDFLGFYDPECYRQSQHSKDALYHLKTATTLAPNFSPTYKWMCYHHQSSGDTVDAMRVAETLVKLLPRCPESLQVRASCYTDWEQHELALRDLRAAVQLSPKDVTYVSSLASKLSALDRVADASSVIQSTIHRIRADIEISPRDSRLYCDLAYMLCDLGEYDQAISAYETAFDFAESDDMRGRAQFLIGVVAYFYADDFDRAIPAFALAKSVGYETEFCDELIVECLQEQSRTVVRQP